ncbi:MAG: 16S rRNA (uracil(1498)-N(3))-methyltransferase [Acetobacteraceae bacterium]
MRPHSTLTPAAQGRALEGGFTEGELDLLARTHFVRPASLGPRILRAETAATAGVALLAASLGGFI